MKLIEKAVSHFSSKAIREIYIDEWEVKLFAKPLSLEDKSKWLARADGDSTSYLVYAVIFGLMDEKGDSVFDVGDINKIKKNVDPEIISTLATFVLDTTGAKEEEREKN